MFDRGGAVFFVVEKVRAEDVNLLHYCNALA